MVCQHCETMTLKHKMEVGDTSLVKCRVFQQVRVQILGEKPGLWAVLKARSILMYNWTLSSDMGDPSGCQSLA
jgi:hypothetical protein